MLVVWYATANRKACQYMCSLRSGTTLSQELFKSDIGAPCCTKRVIGVLIKILIGFSGVG